MTELTIIGRAERIDMPDYGVFGVPAKVDTGADSSSIWASDIHLRNDVLCFKLFGSASKSYTGEEICVPKSQYRITRVANSFGHKELRYSLKLNLVVHGRRIKATVTLANRENKTYPMLLGRRLLSRKFLVDVSKGRPLKKEEELKMKKLQEEILKITNDGAEL